MAKPGEFTRRALENGKMDLTEVEGLSDLLNATTEIQQKNALNHLKGDLKKLYQDWSNQLLNSLALYEAIIDFGDDHEISESILQQGTYKGFSQLIVANQNVKSLMETIGKYIEGSERGIKEREGIIIGVHGAPNAGKSSLANYLANRNASIVSPYAGTTRDIIEIHMKLGGFPIIFCDTAGIRNLNEKLDFVEKEGIQRAIQKFRESDVNIWLIDGEEIEKTKKMDEAFLKLIQEREKNSEGLVIGINKIDKVSNVGLLTSFVHSFVNQHYQQVPILAFSCLTGIGMNSFVLHLEETIKKNFERSKSTETAVITHARHVWHLAECSRNLQAFLEHTKRAEIAAEDLRRALKCLGRITGTVDVENILGKIFSEFCIGK